MTKASKAVRVTKGGADKGGTYANLFTALRYINWLGGVHPAKLIPLMARSEVNPEDIPRLLSEAVRIMESVKSDNGSATDLFALAEVVNLLTSAPGTPEFLRTLALAGVGSLGVEVKNNSGSCLYVAHSASNGGVKIGRSSDPGARVLSLSYTCHDIKLVAQFPEQGHREKDVHKALAKYHKLGEWFSMSPDDAISGVREFLGV